jgi:3-hydroxyisobutyrate dehydrogenase-like beta-hydroxyacid dehydrogenase
MHIGFIGAGFMGHPMVINLLRAGHDVAVVGHRNLQPVEDLARRGAQKVASLGDLAKRAEIIVMCVANSKAVEEVVATLQPHLTAGQIILDMGTSDPAVNRRLAAELAALGVGFAEAPVTGGPEQAAAAELGALVGADVETFKRIVPVLECLCATISHMGPVGSGQTAKLISNYLALGTAAVVADAFNVARQADVDWAKLYAAMLRGSGNSGALRKMVEPALSGDYDGYAFSLANASKDMGYYMAWAGERGTGSAMARQVMAVYDTAVARGHGERRLSRLIDPKLSCKLNQD